MSLTLRYHRKSDRAENRTVPRAVDVGLLPVEHGTGKGAGPVGFQGQVGWGEAEKFSE